MGGLKHPRPPFGADATVASVRLSVLQAWCHHGMGNDSGCYHKQDAIVTSQGRGDRSTLGLVACLVVFSNFTQ